MDFASLVVPEFLSGTTVLDGGVRSPTKYRTPEKFGMALTLAFKMDPSWLINRSLNFSDTWILQLSGIKNSFWPDVSAPEQSSAVISGPNEFLIPDSWRIQVSEKFKLRLINQEGAILKANVRAIPNFSGVRYFVGLRTPPSSSSGKEFRDYKTSEIHQEVASLSAGIPDFKASVSQPKFCNDNMLRLQGDLSRISLWNHWITQARQYAASMANPRKNYPLPSEDHHFTAMKVASCEDVPDEVFGFLGGAKVKLNPLSAPFVDPPARLLERDLKVRQRALRLLSPLLVTRHLAEALARIIQATEESTNRNALCSVRRLMLANSLTLLR